MWSKKMQLDDYILGSDDDLKFQDVPETTDEVSFDDIFSVLKTWKPPTGSVLPELDDSSLESFDAKIWEKQGEPWVVYDFPEVRGVWEPLEPQKTKCDVVQQLWSLPSIGEEYLNDLRSKRSKEGAPLSEHCSVFGHLWDLPAFPKGALGGTSSNLPSTSGLVRECGHLICKHTDRPKVDTLPERTWANRVKKPRQPGHAAPKPTDPPIKSETYHGDQYVSKVRPPTLMGEYLVGIEEYLNKSGKPEHSENTRPNRVRRHRCVYEFSDSTNEPEPKADPFPECSWANKVKNPKQRSEFCLIDRQTDPPVREETFPENSWASRVRGKSGTHRDAIADNRANPSSWVRETVANRQAVPARAEGSPVGSYGDRGEQPRARERRRTTEGQSETEQAPAGSPEDREEAPRQVRVEPAQTCAFCRQNPQRRTQWHTHSLRDAQGRITCPVLFQHTCPQCGATGESAHTLKYCPQYLGPKGVRSGHAYIWRNRTTTTKLPRSQ